MARTERPESRAARKLIEHFGGRAETEEALDVSRETLRLWLRDGIPLERAVDIERDTDGAVTGEQILKEARQAA